MPGEIEPLRTDRIGRPSTGGPVAAQARPRGPAIALDDTMAEAARATLLRHWKRARKAEPGARDGGDIEQVHDLRVAVRRLRVAFRVFADDLDGDALRPFRKPLRRGARVLGAVRDLDVFHEKARRYVYTLPEDRRDELYPLLAAWQAAHDRARRKLIAWLDSGAFARFAAAFDKCLRGPGLAHGRRARRLVRDVVPIVLLDEWTSVRAYDESVTAPGVPVEQLHRLRIACKRLRYTLEFFAPVLGAPVDPRVEQLTRVQDHLGNVQDAVIACGVLEDFLARGEWSDGAERSRRRPHAVTGAPGVAAYLAARRWEIQTLVQAFPQIWAPVRSTEFKKQLLSLIADW